MVYIEEYGSKVKGCPMPAHFFTCSISHLSLNVRLLLVAIVNARKKLQSLSVQSSCY